MVQEISPQLLTFEEFLEWQPEGGHYELHDGVAIEMQPTGKHEEIIAYLARKLTVYVDRVELPYYIPNKALIKGTGNSCYHPDVLLFDKTRLSDEPLWEKSSTITLGTSIPLVVEVVSTNWDDDYTTKVRDYERLSIPEYWIVDYLGLGGKRYIGNPKQPTISIYYLIEGEYQVTQFRKGDEVRSPSFPDLRLLAEQIFQP